MQAKLKNFADRLIGTISADSVDAAVTRASEEARKAGLRRFKLTFTIAETETDERRAMCVR
jgi:hypothetical protein